MPRCSNRAASLPSNNMQEYDIYGLVERLGAALAPGGIELHVAELLTGAARALVMELLGSVGPLSWSTAAQLEATCAGSGGQPRWAPLFRHGDASSSQSWPCGDSRAAQVSGLTAGPDTPAERRRVFVIPGRAGERRGMFGGLTDVSMLLGNRSRPTAVGDDHGCGSS
jgi:hypothetical protein